MTKPDKVKFDFVRYSDPSADLAETDLARLQPVQHDTVKPAGKAEKEELLALRLSFSLPTASYATMAIRELFEIVLFTGITQGCDALCEPHSAELD